MCGTDGLGIVAVGTAAGDTEACIAAPEPCGAVHWRADVVVVPDVFNPFPDISLHIVKPERVRLEGSSGGRWAAIPMAAAAIAVGVALARIVSPGIASCGAGPRGIFPFGFCQKPVVLAGQPREPPRIRLGVVPAH